jgi:hypothetical protein
LCAQKSTKNKIPRFDIFLLRMANQLGYSESVQALMDSMNRLACVKAGHKIRYGPPLTYDDTSCAFDVWSRRVWTRNESVKRTAMDVRSTCITLIQELPRCSGTPVHALLQDKMDAMFTGVMNLVLLYESDAEKEYVWAKHMRDSLRMLRPGELPSAPE